MYFKLNSKTVGGLCENTNKNGVQSFKWCSQQSQMFELVLELGSGVGVELSWGVPKPRGGAGID